MATYDTSVVQDKLREVANHLAGQQNGTAKKNITVVKKEPKAITTNTTSTSKYDTSAYDNMYNDFVNQQNATVLKQKQQTEADYNQRLKEAYISRMQDQKSLNENMAAAGIRGGASETATLKNNINYQNTRNSLNTSKAQAIQDIDDNANANILSYKQTNDAAKQSYIEQREAEERQIAQSEKETAEERAYQAKLDNWTAKYGKYYSLTSLNKALAKAKTNEEKAIINARIGYIKQYKKGY